MILIKPIDNIKMNNLFNVSSIIFNYSLNTNLKCCTTLNHKILDILAHSLMTALILLRLVVRVLLLACSIVVQKVQVWAGREPESLLARNQQSSLCRISSSLIPLLTPHIFTLQVVSLQQQQNMVPQTCRRMGHLSLLSESTIPRS